MRPLILINSKYRFYGFLNSSTGTDFMKCPILLQITEKGKVIGLGLFHF